MSVNTAFKTFILAALFCLVALSGAALFAQTSSELAEINGIKLLANGSLVDTNTTVAFGLTLDGGLSYTTAVSSDDVVELRAELYPDPEHMGQSADLIMAVRLEDKSWMMKDTEGNWLPWGPPTKLTALVPFVEDVTLTSMIETTFFSGMITAFTGKLKLVLAYFDPEGALQFNAVPFVVSVSSQSIEAQAFALFESTISPDIIFGSCIVCHNDGTVYDTSQFNAPYQYELPTNPDYLAINFNILKDLFSSRGKDYILAKASGEILHYGGTQLPKGSQQYQDLADFLTLLEE